MTERELQRRRILIGASCFADALSAFRLFDLTEGLSASEIRGLLVAEPPSEDVKGAPGQRVVTPSGALVAAPSAQRARALIESDAKAFRQRLASIARSLAASWSFETRAGELIEGLWPAEKEHDLLLVGYRTEHRRRGKVVLLTEPSATLDEPMALAEGLGGRLQTEVVSLSCRLERDTEDQGQGAGPTLRALLSSLNRINAEAVVVNFASAPLISPALLRAVLAAARCPLLILGPEKTPPSESSRRATARN